MRLATCLSTPSVGSGRYDVETIIVRKRTHAEMHSGVTTP